MCFVEITSTIIIFITKILDVLKILPLYLFMKNILPYDLNNCFVMTYFSHLFIKHVSLNKLTVNLWPCQAYLITLSTQLNL